MRLPSLLVSRSTLLGALAVSVLALVFDQGCAAFGDLPDYQLAPGAGAAGAAGTTAGGNGGASSGAGGGSGGAGGAASGASGAGGTGAGTGGAGGSGGIAGEGGSDAGGQSGSGGSGGAAGTGAGTGGANGGTAGSGGASGKGGEAGVGGSDAGASGTSGNAGKAGTGGASAGNGGTGGVGGAGAGGSSAGAAGTNTGGGGQAGAAGDPLPEIVAEGQSDPGTLLLDGGSLYWVNRAGGGDGQVAKLAVPAPAAVLPVAPAYVVPTITAAKDIAFFASKLFVLRGAGKAAQSILVSYQTNGTGLTAIQPCLDKPGIGIGNLGAVPCEVTATNRLISSEVGVYFSGKAVGTDESVVTGTKLCGAAAGSCQAAVTEDTPTKAMTAIGSTLYAVAGNNAKLIQSRASGSPVTFVSLTDEVLDLAADGTSVFVLTSGGRIVAYRVSDKLPQVLVPSGAGTAGQRIIVAGDSVYWTASDAGAGKGIVGCVRKNGTGFKILTKDRQGPRGLAVDTSTASPRVYFTDSSDTVQRIQLP